MEIPGRPEAKFVKNSVFLGILLTALFSFSGLQAQSQTQTTDQQQEQQRLAAEQRAAQERQAEQVRQQQQREQQERQTQQLRQQQQREQQERKVEQEQRQQQQSEQQQQRANTPAPESAQPEHLPDSSPAASNTSTPRNHPIGIPATSTAAASDRSGTHTLHHRAHNQVSAPRHRAYTVPPPSSIASERPDGGSFLTPAGSARVVNQVNSARVRMSGINKRALPAGQVTVHPDGHLSLTASGGRHYELRANGTLASFREPGGVFAVRATSARAGTTAKFGPSGRLRSVRTANLDIQHGSQGGRIVVKHLPNQATVVSYGPHSGYWQRTPVVQGNTTLVQRTYVAQSTTYVRTYSSYSYRGVTLLSYVPPVYYAPSFYSWAYYPWAKPVSVVWNWAGYPWRGIHGLYFVPLLVYSSPALWIADDILGSDLEDGYQQQQAAQNANDPDAGWSGPAPVDDDSSDNEAYAEVSTPITPALREEIATEVQQDMAAENAVASDQASADQQELFLDLQPGRLFVVSTLLSVFSDQGNCSLTGGDTIRVVNSIGSDPQTALLSVASSKRGDCPAGAQMEISLQDLQDMDSDLRAQTDDALAKLHSATSQDGLPAAPQSALAPAPNSAANADPPSPEPGVAAMLIDAQQQADQEETALIQDAFANYPKAP
jgi:hypothetical protein